MADEFNLNETTEEVATEAPASKKRGRKSTKAKVETTNVENETANVENVDEVIETPKEEPVEAEPVDEEPVEVLEEASMEDSIESIEAPIEEIKEEVPAEVEEIKEDKTEEEKPLIIIEEEKSTETPKFVNVPREVVYTLPSTSSPKRTVSGRLTILDTCGDYYKVLYIAPGRGTDKGYILKSILEKYFI